MHDYFISVIKSCLATLVIYFRYNCYKLLGFDLLLDADLRVHVVEVNARPQLLDDPLDRAVNRPMVNRLVLLFQ